jgi:hypothetical protein
LIVASKTLEISSAQTRNRRTETVLLRIIRAVSEKTRKDPTFDTVVAFDDNSMNPGMDELGCEKQIPYTMHKLPLQVRQDLRGGWNLE